MEKITSKAVVLAIVKNCVEAGEPHRVARLHTELLQKKVKFPLLETAGHFLSEAIPPDEQIVFLKKISSLKTIGGNVLIGIVLQNRLRPDNLETTVNQALEFIFEGNEWYVCDIIGERVLGIALLRWPERCLPILEKLTAHPNHWAVRSVGVAGHFSVKKGLPAGQVERLFGLLLRAAHSTDFHTRKGIGWAAKTVAKFHPEIIEKFAPELETRSDLRAWFRTKISIGLKINAIRSQRKKHSE